MKFLIGVYFIIASISFIVGQQRVAPGVPRKQYEQQYAPPPPSPQQHQQMQSPQQQMPNQVPQMQQQFAPGVPPQQYQQQQVQYQQVPVQQQQVHQQQVHQQQVHQQQVPQQNMPQQNVPVNVQVPLEQHHQGGHHDHHQQQLLNTANIMQEKDHIQEHIDIPMDISKMTEQELQFHYFKMHDADRNDKLDGCELIKSLIHWHGEGNPSSTEKGPQVHTDEELEAMVDGILSALDKNKDGFVDYVEFKLAND